ncbi:hypothetical protein ABT297_08200 [Dactylosporangium sp. NPDC000555]|uniref:hypothetical protein n=1 Tax=Dactylosporangium sp. NPDC000555 TaxID=3154260 RepID=UPI00332FD79F
MGIDANGYCTQCRTYRGVPQAPQQPTSGTPYSGAPYGGQQPYAGYPTSSGPSYSAPPSYSDPVSAPPTSYGATYGASSSGGGSSRNKFLTPILALSGVLVILVVAIVVVAVVKKGGGDDKKNTPQANSTTGPAAVSSAKASTKPSAKPSSVIDECLVGTWTTKTYTQQMAMDGVGNVPVTLSKNGSTLKFTPDGKLTETYADSTFTAKPTIQGQQVPITITANATVTSNVATTSGSIAYSNVQATGTLNTKAPSINFDETEPFTADDNPAKYTCNGDNLTMSTSQTNLTATKTSTSY